MDDNHQKGKTRKDSNQARREDAPAHGFKGNNIRLMDREAF
jgi:hypothetical protein